MFIYLYQLMRRKPVVHASSSQSTAATAAGVHQKWEAADGKNKFSF